MQHTQLMSMQALLGDSLCDGEFCTIIQEFDVPPEYELQDLFLSYLLDHGAEIGILIGTKREIQQRTKCPFCRFVARGILNSHYAEAQETSQCFTVVKFKTNFWLQIRIPDSPDFGLLMTYSERIVLVNRSDQATATAGRILDDRGINYDLLTNWLSLCDGLHQEICPASDQTRLARVHVPRTLRVVDVKDDHLVEIPWTERYVALSYVWGEADLPKLFVSNLEELYTIGSLKDRRDVMPNTIRDVMVLTANLGLRYLWFDSLCLVQDDAADLMRGVRNMDLVYEGAYATVIAANGRGANSGLPGVGQTPRQGNQDIEVLKPGLEIMRAYSLDEHLNKSVWASRGWTMQEHYLSRRTINFVNNQVYFRCRQRIWCEELWTDRNPNFQDSGEWTTNLVALAQESMDLEETISAPHYYLFLAIERFQHRNLTDQNDAVNAMTGILQRVAQRAKSTTVEGLPIDLFPLALIFLHLQDPTPRRRLAFPSWSWAGWIGNPTWYAFNALNLDEHPEEIGDALSITCAFFRKYDHSKIKGAAGEVLWIPKTSTLESAFLNLSDPDQGAIEFIEMQPRGVSEPTPYGMLSVTAMIIYMKVKHPSDSLDPLRSFNRRKLIVSDKEEHECGYLYLDTDMADTQDQPLMMLLLSKCYKTDYPIHNWPASGKNMEELFWVMFIIPIRDGVYERRGIGQVLQRCVRHSCKPGPCWQSAVLG